MLNDTDTAPALPTSIDVYGFTLALDSFPAYQTLRLAAKGLAHLMGNEVASKVTAAAVKHAAENDGVSWTDDEKAQATGEFREAIWDALTDGEHYTPKGERAIVARKPRLTDEEKEARTLALAEMKVHFEKVAKNVKFPTGKEKVKLGDLELTVADMVARKLAGPSGDRIRAEAAAIVAARKAALASAPTPTAGGLFD